MTTRTKTVPLFGTGYASAWSSVTAQQMVNMFPRRNGDKSEVSYIHTPGYSLVGVGPESTTYPCRGAITANNGMVLAAFKNKVYKYTGPSLGWVALTGTLDNSSGTRVYFAQSAGEILFTDGSKLWRTTDLSTFAQVTVTPTSHGSIAYIANRFVMVDKASAKFYWSDLNNGNSWNALSYATMEGEPGKAVFAQEMNGVLVLFGHFTTEFWQPSPTEVFTRVGAAGIPVGVGPYSASYSPLQTESGIYFMGQPKHGGLPQPFRIVGYDIQSLAGPDALYSIHAQPGSAANNEISYYGYKVAGEEFIVFNLNSSSVPAVQYNVNTSTWSKVGEAATWLVDNSAWQSGGLSTESYYLLFDKSTAANVFKLSPTTYTTNGTAITRKLVTKHVTSDLNPLTIEELTLDIEAGVGTSGGDATPTVKLEVSKDNGHTFVDFGAVSFGASAEYSARPRWHRLGTSRDWVFRFSTTNGVPFVINGGAIRVTQ